MDVTCVPDGRVVVWRKAIFVAAMSAITTISGAGMGLLRDDAEAQIMVTAALTEARSVAQAEGMEFADDPVASALAIAASMPATARSSMSRDDAAGRPLEHEALSGAIVRRGRAVGVPTPVNQALYTLLRLKIAARTEQARTQ
jgi:2-dehydropantoate 2-reductase